MSVYVAHVAFSFKPSCPVRIVWSRIWSLLADFFIDVGCHKNLQVAMYAVDSLRQLSMKFLERDELTNFTFQNDFLRPFVFVMRQSKSVEIRELIIRYVIGCYMIGCYMIGCCMIGCCMLVGCQRNEKTSA